MELFQRNLLQFIRCVRPLDGIAVQPFHQDPKPRPVPLKDLDQCAPALQTANIQREYGSRWNFSLMMAAKPV